VLLAVAPLHVRDSHYVKHDVPATLAIVIACTLMARAWPLPGNEPDSGAPRIRDTIAAAAATGVAFSTHYYCIFLALPLAWSIVLRARRQGLGVVTRHLLVGAGASAIVFFALSPFLLVEPLTALHDIRANREIVVDRAVMGGVFAPAIRYLQMLWLDSVGMPTVLLALAGIVWMTVVDWRRALFLLAFPLPFLAFIANTAPASRYLNPVLPFLALFAAWTIAKLAGRPGARPIVFWGLLALAAAPAAIASVRGGLFFRQADTRTLAQAWIEANIPAGSGVLVQPYSVVLTPSRDSLVEILTRNLGSADAASAKFQLQLSLNPYPQPAYRLVYLGSGGLDADKRYVTLEDLGGPGGLARLRELGVAFVVLKRYNRSDQGALPFLTALEREGRRLTVFSPYRPDVSPADQARIDPFLHNTDTRIAGELERPGPPLEIWQLDGSGVRQP
jgi:hypothetical protein